MFTPKAAFSSFSVDDLEKAKQFYVETLGATLGDEVMGLRLRLINGGTVFIYPKEDHTPASFTVLNFVVDDIEDAVRELRGHGVTFERYEGMPHDEAGIVRPPEGTNNGPSIAWFKDPAGNILAVIEDTTAEDIV